MKRFFGMSVGVFLFLNALNSMPQCFVAKKLTHCISTFWAAAPRHRTAFRGERAFLDKTPIFSCDTHAHEDIQTILDITDPLFIAVFGYNSVKNTQVAT